LRYFCEVAETGSFTRAAKVVSVPPSSLSRRIAGLEDSLGATLLKRSTRSVAASNDAKCLVRHALAGKGI